MAGQYLRPRAHTELPEMPYRVKRHAEFAVRELQRVSRKISGSMRKHQLKLADRQCTMSLLSQRIQSLIVVLATSLYAARQTDPVIRDAADLVCQQLLNDYRGSQPTDKYFRTVTELGETILDGGFETIAGISADEILMKYDV